MHARHLLLAFCAMIVSTGNAQRAPAAGPAKSTASQSAPITNIRYDVTFDAKTAAARRLNVAMTFDAGTAAPVILSLPVWTPGAYDVSNFARNVLEFSATSSGQPVRWDKVDHDTWRVRPGRAGTVTVTFDFVADSLDNAMSWSRPDFLLFNGTNVFLYPEGRTFDFPATVTVKTDSGWQVATGMDAAGAGRAYREGNYHDLVDMPFFIGRFDIDSLQVDGKWTRLATYPAGRLAGAQRDAFRQEIARMIPPEARVFGETPWDAYTVMMIFEPGHGSALEHQNSHVGIYDPQFIGNPLLASITAHEIFHAWNVKRLRPADMFPYRYAAAQPTTLLWVSEGITDYYADIALVRGGIIDSTAFIGKVMENMAQVAQLPPVALEDASLSTWIQPQDGTGYIYYPKGSLAGFMLDIIIRDASDDARSLDAVMRSLYASTYKRGRGFTTEEFLAAASRAAGGKSLTAYYDRYIDGRDAYPWASVLPLAGLRFVEDSVRVPRLGVTTIADSSGGLSVGQVAPGSMAAAAGVLPGDVLVSVGDIQVHDQSFGQLYRQQYGTREGAEISIVVRRDGQPVTLTGKVAMTLMTQSRVTFDPAPSGKALKIRRGLLKGS